MDTVLSLDHVSKVYHNGRGAKNISFSVARGQVVGLLGPNGSGKTTIMKSITGLSQPSEGSITIFDAPSTDREASLKHVGALIEQPALYENLTAWDHLVMAARFYPAVDEKRMDQVLTIVGLAPYKKERCGKFSLGMKQRMGIALALLSEPELMILDEPTNGLDIEATWPLKLKKCVTRSWCCTRGRCSPSTPRRRPCACTPPWKITSWRRCGTKRAPWCCKKGEILMQAFAASLQNELFKLRKRKKYLVLLIIASAICVVSALRVLIVNYLTDGGVSREAILGGLMSSNMPFVLLIFLPLMAIMAAGDLYVGEQVDHTIRFSLMRPVGKAKLFFSKAAAVWVLCAFDLAVLYLVSTLSQVCLGGGIEGIFSSFFACVLDLIPMAVLILFVALINQLVKGSSLTVLLCVVCYVALVVFGTYMPSVGGLVFTGYLRWHNLWIGVTLPFLSLLPRIGLLAGYGLVFGCGGYLLFDRKEA